MKMKYLVVGLLCSAALVASLAHAAPPGADNSRARANQTFDANVYRIFFDGPGWGDAVESPVRFILEITGDFEVARDLACSPASACYGKEPQFRLNDIGHCHIYVENASTRTRVAFDSSCRPEVEIRLNPGDYCAYADLTHNDHVARYKPGPQDLPAFDKVCFTVSR